MLEFNYFSIDSLRQNLSIEIYDGLKWTVFDTIKSTSQIDCFSPWVRYHANISQYKGKNVKIRFSSIDAGVSRHGGFFSIDNFKVYDKTNIDANLLTISSPASNCEPDSVISVQIENYGTLTLNSIPVSYQVNNGSVISETFSTNILPGATAIYNFNQKSNFDLPNSLYTIKSWVSLPGDSNQLNDTSVTQIINTTHPANYFEDFESLRSGSGCPWVANYNFLDSIGNWTTTLLNEGWRLKDNSMCSFNAGYSGPRYDHTIGNGTGSFMALDLYNDYLDESLISSCLDFSRDSSIALSFWYHKYGNRMKNLFVDVYANGVWNMSIDSVMGQTQFSQTGPWKQKAIQLNQFSGQVIKVRFRVPVGVVISGGLGSTMAIDDVHIYNPLTTSIKTVQPQKVFNLYPNPNNGNFNLNVSNELVGKQYQVFDVKGGLVKQARIGSTQSQIELSNAQKGVYFLKIEDYAKAERIVVL